jgi:hypothetical protein
VAQKVRDVHPRLLRNYCYTQFPLFFLDEREKPNTQHDLLIIFYDKVLLRRISFSKQPVKEDMNFPAAGGRQPTADRPSIRLDCLPSSGKTNPRGRAFAMQFVLSFRKQCGSIGTSNNLGHCSLVVQAVHPMGSRRIGGEAEDKLVRGRVVTCW